MNSKNPKENNLAIQSSNTVVHVSSAHPHTDNRVHYRECNSLVEAGFDVTLVAVESELAGHTTNVKVIEIPRRKRVARMLLSSFEAIQKAVATRARIVHMHDPELIPFIPLLRLAGRIVIYDAHEDLPAQVKNKSYLRYPSAQIIALFSRILVRIAHFSNLIVCATETISNRYPQHKTVVVHNYPPLREAEAEVGALDIEKRDARIVYVGGLSEGRGASVMVTAMAQSCIPEDWRLRIAGSVTEPYLQTLQAKAGWNRVDFDGQIEPEAARDLILGARIGLVVLTGSEAYLDSLPTKMFEYFAAGVPVIASNFPLWRTIVEDNDCGVLVSPESPAQIANAIKEYAENPDLLVRHSQNARKLAVNYLNWAPEGKILIEAYDELLKNEGR